MALKWTDLDIKRRIIHVQRSVWRGRKVAEVHETVPKGGKGRKVTMTGELAAAHFSGALTVIHFAAG